MHADQESISFFAVSGSSLGSVTSATANTPLFLNTRNDSRNTASLSGERLITQLEITYSTELDSTGRCSISPRRNSAFGYLSPYLLAVSLARQIISGVASIPM